MNSIWFNKHRPQVLKDFVGQDTLIPEFEKILFENHPMQHYIFHSAEAGTGKTTLAHIIAKTLGYNIFTFNASSKRTRGIEFVEEDIIPLANSGMWETIILLDEADRLTIQAQDSLKGVIENATCYFILTCNDLSKVSTWLQLRCQVRNFAKIPENIMQKKLLDIAKEELCEVDINEIANICRYHSGDLRNAISCLQAYASLDRHERTNFILSLGDLDFDAKVFTHLCVKEKALEQGFSKLKEVNIRSCIKETMLYIVSSEAPTRVKAKVIEASIQSERDFLMGIDEEIVKWNYCRLLCES